MNPSNPDFSGADDAVNDAAATWFAREQEGLDRAGLRARDAWLAADPRHARALGKLRASATLLTGLRGTGAGSDLLAEVENELGRRPVARPATRRWLRMGVGLAAALCFGLAVWFLRGTEKPFAETYATSGTGFRQVALPDGSAITLNGASEVSVVYQRRERHLELTRGEAHFVVAKDASRPFIVATGAVAVRAVGTAFNVRRGETDVEIIVTEGKVRVTRSQPGPEGSAQAEPLALAAGEHAVLSLSGALAAGDLGPLDPARLHEKLAWQSSRLTFSDTPLAEVLQRFNRHNAVQVELGDPDLGNRPVAGSFSPDNVEAFVSLLAAGGDIRVERPAPDRLVLYRGR